jgi:hypothetical protein
MVTTYKTAEWGSPGDKSLDTHGRQNLKSYFDFCNSIIKYFNRRLFTSEVPGSIPGKSAWVF